VPRDLHTAILCFSRAAIQGFEDSKKSLLYLASAGVPEAIAAVWRLRLAL